MNVGIVVAAGKSERVGANVDKAFLSLGTKPVLAYSLLAFEKCKDIDAVVLVVRKDRVEGARAMAQMYGASKVTRVVAGGGKRQVSVQKGIDSLPDDTKVVSVHDGARPCVTPEIISETIKCAKRYGSGVAGVKLTDTIKYVERGVTVKKTIDRDKLWAVQTPQTFKLDLLQKAFDAVQKKKVTVTDEAQAVELVSNEVRLVPSVLSNIKITTADDLMLAAALLKL
ncbi:2-C-methyl-D-erythritol 4-phosphate cytidylyltransferase [bacterium E08(2017)]|nr:2-C-methyl-D-erythritol 4-phosphate cytidylyltransferase [bacterium E08(2017)]